MVAATLLVGGRPHEGAPVASGPTAVASPTCGTPVGSPAVAGSPAPGARQSVSVAATVTIRLTDWGFVPSDVEATNGHDLTVTLANTGTRRHGFRLARFGIAVSLAPGETRRVTIGSPDLGDFAYVSDAPCDAGMRGTLTFFI